MAKTNKPPDSMTSRSVSTSWPGYIAGACPSSAFQSNGEWMRSLLHLVITAVVMIGLSACAGDPVIGIHELVSVQGRTLYVETFGKGSPIVFLHGGLHHFDNAFESQRDDFAPSHRVIGIDQRGHGHSPDDSRPFSYEEMAQDTAAVIRQLHLGVVDVVGHSDGGNVALRLALARPDLVRRVVISGANLRAGLPADELQRRLAWTPQQLAEFLPKLEARLPPGFKSDYAAVAPQGADYWGAFLAKSYQLWLTPVVISSAELKSINVPVLVIAGDKDFISLEETVEIYRNLGNAQLFIVPGTGHATFADREGLVDLAIRRFLESP